MPVRVTAAMIVRDEERFLGDCLASLAGHLDEIVVVDTGSVDRTPEIASAHGARIFFEPWRDDFAAARNSAVDRATGDWILWIDADDRLEMPDGLRLSELLDDPKAAAATVTMQWREGLTVCRELRLFRNDPRIRFRGIIFESLMDGVEAVCRDDGRVIRDTPVRINHLGYEGDLTRKHRRNLALLRRALEAEPGHVFYWGRLAEILAALGEREEAMEASRRSIDLSRAARGGTAGPDAGLAYQVLAQLMAEGGEDPLPVIEEGLQVTPDNYLLRFGRARALIEAGRCEDALAILDGFLATGANSVRPHATGYDVRLFGELAHDQRGVALVRLERFEEAAEAFEAAARAAPDNLSYRVKAAAMRGRARRSLAS